MASRKKEDLHPELAKRFQYLKDNWEFDNEPILTATYRSYEDQLEVFKLGASNARPGQSLHNYRPALAFDVAFIDDEGVADWNWNQFKEWGKRAEKLGLEWGGRWDIKGWDIKDGPHVQMPMTWQEAQSGMEPPPLPPLPKGKTVNDYLKSVVNKLKNVVGILRSKSG